MLGMPASQACDIGTCIATSSSEIAKDPETSFRKLFGEAFAKAYEEQLGAAQNGHDGNVCLHNNG